MPTPSALIEIGRRRKPLSLSPSQRDLGGCTWSSLCRELWLNVSKAPPHSPQFKKTESFLLDTPHQEHSTSISIPLSIPPSSWLETSLPAASANKSNMPAGIRMATLMWSPQALPTISRPSASREFLMISKARMDPGCGGCPPYTVGRAIFSDAVTLVRSDRFYTLVGIQLLLSFFSRQLISPCRITQQQL